MKSFRLFVCILAIAMAVPAVAQRFPGRDRGGSPRDMPSRDAPRNERAAMPSDPFASLERELPSLTVDLMLKGDQVAAWNVFERDIRDVAEMGRQRTRYLLSLRDPGEKAPAAGELLAKLADEDRRRAEATAALRQHFDALYAMFDDAQRRMIDRRLVLSQTEPLGQEAPPKR